MHALLALALAPALATLDLWLHTALDWLLAHPEVDVGLAIWGLASVVNKLQKSPAGKEGLLSKARALLDRLSGLPHADAYGILGALIARLVPDRGLFAVLRHLLLLALGWFNLPGAPSTPKSAVSSSDGSSRGLATLDVLLALAAIASLVASIVTLSWALALAAVIFALAASAEVSRLGALVALLLVSMPGCAIFQGRGATFLADVLHCATDEAIAAVGPLVQTLAEAALHKGQADWAAELEKLKAQAGDLKDCVILAALNAVGPQHTAPPGAPPTIAALFEEPPVLHDEAQIVQAKLRLRAALSR